MLTLDELKEAVAGWDSLVKSESVINKCKVAEFARDYIAREELLDTPLTAEICERLGPSYAYDRNNSDYWVYAYGDMTTGPCMDVSLKAGRIYIYNQCEVESPTIRHLLAAATLAGVAVDLDKLV